MDWRNDMDNAPRDGTEILLHYFDFCGEPLTVSGHWHSVAGREFEDTWEHSCGYGDADMWMPMPDAPAPELTQGEIKEMREQRDATIGSPAIVGQVLAMNPLLSRRR